MLEDDDQKGVQARLESYKNNYDKSNAAATRTIGLSKIPGAIALLEDDDQKGVQARLESYKNNYDKSNAAATRTI